MVGSSPHPSHHHSRKFYIFMITLIVGGMFFLLFLNDDSNGGSITSAFVGYTGENSIVEQDEDLSERVLNEVMERELVKSKNEVEISLSFNKIPNFKKEARIGSMKLNFED